MTSIDSFDLPPRKQDEIPLMPTDDISEKISARFAFYKELVIILIGSFVEWYDFIVLGLLTSQIEANFFSSGSSEGHTKGFITFGIAFIFRPIGSLIFGYIADRHGRIISLKISVLVMGIATLGMGSLPPYAIGGVYSTIGLFTFRILQGISVGGEGYTANVTVLEKVPLSDRAWYLSWVNIMGSLGIKGGNLVVFLLTTRLSDAEMNDYGWRIPFFLSFGLLTIVAFFRQTLVETEDFTEIRQIASQQNPIRRAFSNEWHIILFQIGMKLHFSWYIIGTWIPDYLHPRIQEANLSIVILALIKMSLILPISAFITTSTEELGKYIFVLFLSVFFLIPWFFYTLDTIETWYQLTFYLLPWAFLDDIKGLLIDLVCFDMASDVMTRVVVVSVSHNFSGYFWGNYPLFAGIIVDQGYPVYYVAYMLVGFGIVSFLVTLVLFKTSFVRYVNPKASAVRLIFEKYESPY